MSDKELIDKLAVLYECVFEDGKPNRTKLAEKIYVEYPTLAEWYRKNKIPTYKRHGKLYLETLYKLKKAEKELGLYKDIENVQEALKSFQNQ